MSSQPGFDCRQSTDENSLCKFVDDTYLIIAASNEASRHAELVNIHVWVEQNNLRLNSNKSCDVIFTDSRRRRRHVAEPAPLPEITRSRILKMLGVDIASDFSVLRHVQRLVSASKQTIYALHVLRSHGLSNAAVQHVYWVTVVARLTYTASVWYSLIKACDCQRMDSMINRARRYRYCALDLPSFDELLNHVLHALLPPPSIALQYYNLRECSHSLQLPEHSAHLSDSNFITHMLYKNIY